MIELKREKIPLYVCAAASVTYISLSSLLHLPYEISNILYWLAVIVSSAAGLIFAKMPEGWLGNVARALCVGLIMLSGWEIVSTAGSAWNLIVGIN